MVVGIDINRIILYTIQHKITMAFDFLIHTYLISRLRYNFIIALHCPVFRTCHSLNKFFVDAALVYYSYDSLFAT